MRILHVVASINPALGGVAEAVRSCCIAMKSKNCESTVICSDAPGAPFVDTFPADRVVSVEAKRRYGFGWRYLRALNDVLRDADVVCVHGVWQFHSLAVSLMCWWHGIPYIVFPHGMLDDWFRVMYPKKHLKKLVYWTLFEQFVTNRAKWVVFTSDNERDSSMRSFPFFRCRPLVRPLGIEGFGSRNDTSVEFIRAFPQLEGKSILLFLGRIHEKKGCDLLLEAFAKTLPWDSNVHLVFAGPCESTLRNVLSRRACELGISQRVVWTGMVSGSLKWGALCAADAFCLPSHQENFGVAVAEALSCSVPVLISSKVDIWPYVASAGAGLIESDDLSGVTRMLETWFATPPGKVKKMRDNAQRCFTGNFSVSAFGDALQKVLGAAVASRGSVYPSCE
jgi:glycosyltransferase involved in cell wall biosynthesis